MFYTQGLLIAAVIEVIFGKSDFYRGPYRCSCDDEAEFTSGILPSALRNLQCCHGLAQCNQPRNYSTSGFSDIMLCFSEISCIITDHKVNISGCSNLTSDCSGASLRTYNVSNIMGEVSKYQCLLVNNTSSPLCLLPLCHSFTVLERSCVINMSRSNFYTCYTDWELPDFIKLGRTELIYTVFFSFADNYVSGGNTSLLTVRIFIILIFTLLLLGCLAVIVKYLHMFRECFLHRRRGDDSGSPHCSSPAPEKSPSDPVNAKSNNSLPTYEEVVKGYTTGMQVHPTIYTIMDNRSS